MKVYKYSEKLKELLGCKTNPEPWMHIVIQGDEVTSNQKLRQMKNGKYAIYVWDTREVLEEGKVKPEVLYNYYSTKAGRGVSKHVMGEKILGQYARDNGQPLKGSKLGFNFDGIDENDLKPLKLSGLRLHNAKFIYDVGTGANVSVACKVNGIDAVFYSVPQRFGYKDGADFVKFTTNTDSGRITKTGTGSGGFYSNDTALHIFNLARKPVGKSQHFVGQKYSLDFLPKEFADALLKLYNEHPELISSKFKKTFNCYK